MSSKSTKASSYSTTHPAINPSEPYEGLSMSQNEEAKRDAERKVSEELANQPKQNGAGTEESKDRRAEAEKKLKDIRTPETTAK
jgi:hypothetical protein